MSNKDDIINNYTTSKMKKKIMGFSCVTLDLS